MSNERPTQPNEQPPIERFPIGRSIVNRIRTEVNDEDGAFGTPDVDDVFGLLYLTERDGCVPEEILSGEDLLNDIRSLYYCVFDGVRSELKDRLNVPDFLWVIVDASYEDATEYVLMTDEKVLLAVTCPPKTDPRIMRVFRALKSPRRTQDEEEQVFGRADRRCAQGA